jgi:hypothetical protein
MLGFLTRELEKGNNAQKDNCCVDHDPPEQGKHDRKQDSRNAEYGYDVCQIADRFHDLFTTLVSTVPSLHMPDVLCKHQKENPTKLVGFS